MFGRSNGMILGFACLLALAASVGCVQQETGTHGEAISGQPAPTPEGQGTSEGEGVPILSTIGQPLIDVLQPEDGQTPVTAVTPLPGFDRTIAVVAGKTIWFEFMPKKKSMKWYRGFTIELVGFETVIGPDLGKDKVIEQPSDGSWSWSEKSGPPSGNMASPRIIEIQTIKQDAPGTYLATFKITPFYPMDENKLDAKSLELVGVVVVQP